MCRVVELAQTGRPSPPSQPMWLGTARLLICVARCVLSMSGPPPAFMRICSIRGLWPSARTRGQLSSGSMACSRRQFDGDPLQGPCRDEEARPEFRRCPARLSRSCGRLSRSSADAGGVIWGGRRPVALLQRPGARGAQLCQRVLGVRIGLRNVVGSVNCRSVIASRASAPALRPHILWPLSFADPVQRVTNDTTKLAQRSVCKYLGCAGGENEYLQTGRTYVKMRLGRGCWSRALLVLDTPQCHSVAQSSLFDRRMLVVSVADAAWKVGC